MNLSVADIALERVNNVPNHYQVLGNYYTDRSGSADSLIPCGPDDKNPFGPAETADKTQPTSFTFRKRSKTEVTAALQADVKNALIAANVPAEALENLQAEFAATYSRVAGADRNISGRYYRLRLKTEVINGIKNIGTANTKAKACGDKLRATPASAFIYSIAVIELNKASYASNVATDAVASFAAKIRQKAPNADIASVEANVKSAVTKEVTANLGEEDRVISWDYLQLAP
jgi:hypothetical protein